MNIVRVATLKCLTENLYESLEALVAFEDDGEEKVREAFDTLQDHVGRYLPKAKESNKPAPDSQGEEK